jgi:FAD/FMN-containing dehydrogenase
VPITPRGSGTGNYGQAVPLAGGIVLDMSALQDIEWQRSGIVRAAAGAKMHDIDVRVRPSGFELRMHPSTAHRDNRRIRRRRFRRHRFH